MKKRTANEPVGEFLVRLFDQPDCVLTRRQLRQQGEAGDLLLRWGAMLQDETLTSVACQSCGEDHAVDLRFDTVSRTWMYYCSSVGFVAVDEDDLVTFCFDFAWLFARLTEFLQIQRPRGRVLVPDVLWDLGDAVLGGRLWSAFLARAVDVNLDAILDALSTRGGKLKGLILTSTVNAPRSLQLPHGHRFIMLSDCFNTASGKLDLVVDHVVAAVQGSRPVVEGRRRGRRSRKSLVIELFERRVACGETVPTLKGEAATLHQLGLQEYPGVQIPAARTIENLIRTAFNELGLNRPGFPGGHLV